jgi:hypothetical protein
MLAAARPDTGLVMRKYSVGNQPRRIVGKFTLLNIISEYFVLGSTCLTKKRLIS